MQRFSVVFIGIVGLAAFVWGQQPAITMPSAKAPQKTATSKAAPFNYVIGTQTFSPSYQFTKQTRLVETAEAIRELGATVIKFEMAKRYGRPNGNIPEANPAIRTLTELARDEPSHRRVLDMPFSYYVLWAHTFSDAHEHWRKGFPPAEQAAEYREMYEFVRHLLKTYNGSGKTFFLGHWEGDGLLRGDTRPQSDARVTGEAVQGMVDWLSTRQRAVDNAKRDTPHTGVQVWHYTEVNHVQVAMQGRKAVTNEVLPKAPVDFVSYSSYDTQNDPNQIKAALDFIESKLTPKPGIAGKRVFIGEYGFPAVRYTPAQQDEMSRRVMQAGLEWGCPFVLYWELYNNEVDKDGRQQGFWLINDQGVKQPVYETHRRYYEWARQFVAETTRRAGQAPTEAEFRKAAAAYLRPSS
jgi:hypothetical protein